MTALLVVPLVLQGIAMLVDELWFHRARSLPRWERIGHPIDTLSVAICLMFLLAVPPTERWLGTYIVLALVSTLLVTKDEWVHARSCSAGEHWLHAVLFALHPIVLGVFALAWWTRHEPLLIGQLIVTLAFAGYQLVYWNVVAGEPVVRAINNTWYADLGTRWYSATDTPIALLRAEARHRNPWIRDTIMQRIGVDRYDVLDLGCGGGFLANYLAEQGHRVVGIDTTPENLDVARRHDRTGSVRYEVADACKLPFPDASFDVVCAMDLIEHVESADQLVAEANRVLRPGGVVFFHTFNRNWLANLIVIKGVELFVKNTPKDLHVLRLFRTPGELDAMLHASGFDRIELRGSRPRFRWPLWRMLLTREVGDDFAFTFTPSIAIGITGVARKALAEGDQSFHSNTYSRSSSSLAT